ncbi:hypothetical protein FRX31_025172 [Thalictrum thalictroides]|uniref:Uncharacterized protein n=1 Tax=Thalictrum thalictroides TaxID=46969 RepID=A0A7J6VKE5_THATH|nr:hypothetical protein FRX31_025172 [Thalictrum thalictroides]
MDLRDKTLTGFVEEYCLLIMIHMRRRFNKARRMDPNDVVPKVTKVIEELRKAVHEYQYCNADDHNFCVSLSSGGSARWAVDMPAYQILPPPLHRPTGRPRGKRRRGEDEPTKSNSKVRRCNKCGSTQHTRATCKGLSREEIAAKAARGRFKGRFKERTKKDQFAPPKEKGVTDKGEAAARGRGRGRGRGEAAPPFEYCKR